jgi:hypothetical protein
VQHAARAGNACAAKRVTLLRVAGTVERHGKIRIRREEPAATKGYRDASAPRAPVTVSFSTRNWFALFMIFITGGGLVAFVTWVLSVLLPERVALGIGLTLWCYVMLALLVNRATIRVDAHGVTARLGPLPIWRGKTLPTSRIRAVVAAQSATSGTTAESTNVGWYVVAQLHDGDEVILSRSLDEHDEAKLVARTLEDALGIGVE